MLARGAFEAILIPLLIGSALVLGGVAAHFGIGAIMTGRGGGLLTLVIAVPGAVLVLYALFLVWFFRDPERVPAGPGLVSGADGKVLFVEPVDDPDVGPGHRIAVFMSPLDVHVNRAPTAARLIGMTHHDGGYLPAFNKESERNERMVTQWRTTGADGLPADQPMKMVQIAGALARRIVPWAQEGSALERGERYGMIKLGSRLDLYLPQGYTPVVTKGQRVHAGRTVVASAPVEPPAGPAPMAADAAGTAAESTVRPASGPPSE